MLDNLKDHIANQRDDFDTYPFDPANGWKELSKHIKKKEDKWSKWKILSAAACLLLVAIGSYYYSSSTPAISSELSEVQQYYTAEIDAKIMLVKSQIKDPRVIEDLEAMDEAFAELKGDLKDNVDNEEVIAAMMENYQLKLRILEEILNELEKENGKSSL